MEKCNIASCDAVNPNAPLIISSKSENSDFNNYKDIIAAYLYAGQPVMLEHVTESEINGFLKEIGFTGLASQDAIISQDTYYEFYGIKLVSGDIFSYVITNDEETPDAKNVPSPDEVVYVKSGDVIVSVDMDEYNAPRRQRPDSLILWPRTPPRATSETWRVSMSARSTCRTKKHIQGHSGRLHLPAVQRGLG